MIPVEKAPTKKYLSAASLDRRSSRRNPVENERAHADDFEGDERHQEIRGRREEQESHRGDHKQAEIGAPGKGLFPVREAFKSRRTKPQRPSPPRPANTTFRSRAVPSTTSTPKRRPRLGFRSAKRPAPPQREKARTDRDQGAACARFSHRCPATRRPRAATAVRKSSARIRKRKSIITSPFSGQPRFIFPPRAGSIVPASGAIF
jgi:hypothetical protein